MANLRMYIVLQIKINNVPWCSGYIAGPAEEMIFGLHPFFFFFFHFILFL